MKSETSGNSTARNIDLAIDFTRSALEAPELLDLVPDGATVVFVPDDDPELAEQNIDAGVAAVRAGEDVYFLHLSTTERVSISDVG